MKPFSIRFAITLLTVGTGNSSGLTLMAGAAETITTGDELCFLFLPDETFAAA